MAEISGNGIKQEDLVNFLASLKTNMDGVCAKLDADSGVSGTNYQAVVGDDVTVPAGIQTTGAKCIRDMGVVMDYLETWITAFNELLTKLDADGGVADTDYSSLHAIADFIGGRASDGLARNAMHQGSLVSLFQTIVTNWNAALTKLDADGTVNNTNYNSLWALTDNINDTACEARPLSHGGY